MGDSRRLASCFVVALRFIGTCFTFGHLILFGILDHFIIVLDVIGFLLVLDTCWLPRASYILQTFFQEPYYFRFYVFLVCFNATSWLCICVPLVTLTPWIPFHCFQAVFHLDWMELFVEFSVFSCKRELLVKHLGKFWRGAVLSVSVLFIWGNCSFALNIEGTDVIDSCVPSR